MPITADASYSGIVEGYFKQDELSSDLCEKLNEYRSLTKKTWSPGSKMQHWNETGTTGRIRMTGTISTEFMENQVTRDTAVCPSRELNPA